jgi:hypothetical protein
MLSAAADAAAAHGPSPLLSLMPSLSPLPPNVPPLCVSSRRNLQR